MEFVLEEGKDLRGECSTLILPALSIGNVGQLAVDLLVASTRAERVAYESSSNGLAFVQQRGPILKGRMIDFAKNFADFIAASGKKHVVVLSSLDFSRWQKVDMSSGLQMYYLSSVNADGTDEACQRLGWKRLEEYNPAHKKWEYLSTLAEGNPQREDSSFCEGGDKDEDYYPSLPFASLFSCLKAKGLKVTCLLCYCSEGDNMSDAFQLAEAACKLVGLNPRNFNGNADGGWVIPFSWQTVYGPPPDICSAIVFVR
ncbi:Proteasome assembly chaperone 2 [Dillenia turbinata]|uniref:Proteasome assembly chaperone 2 n=1 Tax=Dillenia turbinata TaxID=194707 RepID=A0AAN8WDZ5_9MAGN